jgi:hypothetical protein
MLTFILEMYDRSYLHRCLAAIAALSVRHADIQSL